MRVRAIPAVLLLVLLAAGSAQADYQFTFADSSGTFTNNFTLSGPTIDIRVYLTQTTTGSDTTGLINIGLNQAGIQLNTSDATVATVTKVTPNDTNNSGTFDKVNTTSGTGAHAFLTEGYTNTSTGLKANVSAPTSYLATAVSGNNSVYLGTFTFTGLSAGTTATISAVPSGGDLNVLADSTVIDGLITNSTATISVVPEPGTFVLCGAFAAGLAGVAARRLRRKATAAA
jgi:hypothetical protein